MRTVPPKRRPTESKSGISTWRRKLRSFWFKVHLYIALAIGPIFVILGLTGATNVFYRELEELGLPGQTHHGEHLQPRSLNDIMQILKSAHPQKTGPWTLVMPGYNTNYLWAIYKHPEETVNEFYAPLRVLVDAGSGEIVKESFWGKTLWTVIYQTHASFLAGRLGPGPGKLAFKTVCFVGLLMLISVLSGVYLWWPRQGKFVKAISFKRRASPERFYFDLHKISGFYTAPILIVLAFTGFTFSYSDYIKPLIQWFSPVRPGHLTTPDLKSEFVTDERPISITDAVAIANGIFPDGELRAVETPDGKTGVYLVEIRQMGEANRLRPRTRVWIDQYSGKVLAIHDPNRFTAGETFLNLMWPLHSGEALGLPGRVAWSIAGFSPLLLYFSGLIRWLQKRKAAQWNESVFKHRVERGQR